MIFTKPLTEQHGTGLLLIGMGITLKLLPENKQNQRVSNSSAKSKMSKPSTSEDRIIQIGNVEDEEKRPLV